MKLITTFAFICIFSLNVVAHQLRCEIFDLPAGENLIQTGIINLSDQDLRKNEPYKLQLTHDLIAAEFSVSYSDENYLLFEVRTQEVVNAEYDKFTVPIKSLKSDRFIRLGYVSTELTGIGNNTFSQCYLKYEMN